MQAMKCEICGSNDIVKQEGIYVCQHCGTKYTVEEAKKLIGTVKVDKTEENEKYLVLARRATKNEDADNALKYWALVGENDPMNWEAVFYQAYFNVKKDPSDLGIMSSFSKAIDDAIDLIHDNEPAEKQPELVKELAEKILGTYTTYWIEVSGILHEYVMKCIDTPFSVTLDIPKIVSYHLPYMNSAAKKIREYYPELENEAKELEAKAKEYEDYVEEQFEDGRNYRSNAQKREYDAQRRELRRSSGGCYIATCVYGSYDCPQVWTLRRYRDNTLAATWYGRTFIRVYYAVSPKLVKLFGNTSWFKALWQAKLDKLVQKLHNEGVSDTPYTDK